MKELLIIIGSASANSSNHRLAAHVAGRLAGWKVSMINDLKTLPPFDPALADVNTPVAAIDFRQQIERADAVLICTPEYIFSIPSTLKNALEWCVATMVFNEKPVAVITASAHGEKGHEELQLILRTLGAQLHADLLLIIQGIKGKITQHGEITDGSTRQHLDQFAEALSKV